VHRRVKNALEQHGQSSGVHQPAHIVPSGRMLQHAFKGGGMACQRVIGGCCGRQVDGANTGGQVKPGAAFAVAGTVHGGVHREHDGLVARGLGTGQQLQCHVALRLQVQLEPQGAGVVGCGVGGIGCHAAVRVCHVLKRGAGLGAEHQPCAQRCGGIGGGQFAIGVGHALKGNWGQQDGVGQRAAQQADAGVPARQGAQHARPQGQGVPRAAVGAQGDFIGRPAAEVGPGVVVQLLARVLFVVGQAHHMWGDGLGSSIFIAAYVC
jgi:hypothetical protein